MEQEVNKRKWILFVWMICAIMCIPWQKKYLLINVLTDSKSTAIM